MLDFNKRGLSKLTGIQWLRGLAALSVLFGHAQNEAFQMSGGTFERIPFTWGIGVDVFFVISGFIMAYTSTYLYGQDGGWRKFFKRRVIRVVPLYYVFTFAMVTAIVFVPSQLATASFDWARLIASLLFFPYPDSSGVTRPILALGWTLNYEMFFYLVFALSLLFKQRGPIFLALTISSLCIFGLIFDPENYLLAFWTNIILVDFLAGVILGWFYLNRDVRISPVLAFLFLLTAFLLLFNEVRSDVLNRAFFSVLLVWFFSYYSFEIFDNARLRFFSLLGDASYSIYLSHPFSLAVFKMFWPYRANRDLDMAYVLGASIFSVVAGVIVYFVIERNIVKLFRSSSV